MSIFEDVISWLAPTQCVICNQEGPSLCQACQAAEILPHGERCGFCGQLSFGSKTCKTCKTKGAPNFIWLSTDYQGAAKELLGSYKFGHQRAAADALAQIMADTFWVFNGKHTNKNYLIVPIPTASSRIRARSFDHTALLAKKLSKHLGFELSSALKRQGQTRQVGAKRNIRLTQQIGNYYVMRSAEVAGRNILLIDDVITTGGTMRAAYKALRKAGAKQVEALAFAKRL